MMSQRNIDLETAPEMSGQPKSTTTYYLEMLDPQALCPKEAPAGLEVSMVSPPSPALNRRLYDAVGKDWDWTDRLVWSEEEWNRYVHRSALETWLGKYQGQTAGYFELECQAEGNVEIAYFGLLPGFVGRGLGGSLLTAAIRRAWQFPGSKRLWVHTCNWDHPAALSNYQRRGFKLYSEELT